MQPMNQNTKSICERVSAFYMEAKRRVLGSHSSADNNAGNTSSGTASMAFGSSTQATADYTLTAGYKT